MEAETAKFKWQDACGIVGVILAVAAMTDMPILLREACIVICALCLPISFFSYKHWPQALQWIGSVIVVGFMGYVGMIAWKASLPKIVHDVFLEWRSPAPMDFGATLSEHQLNAAAKYEGVEVPGRYVYSPTFGSSMPPGTDTLSVEFTPNDPNKFKSASEKIVVIVREETVRPLHRPSPRSSNTGTLSEPRNPVASPPPTINNAPGGFAVSGGTLTNPTVNNLSVPPRAIDQDERNKLISCLKENPGIVGIDAISGDAEGGKFGESLVRIFHEAGWTVDEDRVKYLIPVNGYYSGTQITFRGTHIDADGSNLIYDKALPSAKALCFVGIHMHGGATISPKFDLGEKRIAILIGEEER